MVKKKSKSSKAKGLSKSEKAVLARFQKSTDVFEEYMSAVQELAAAQDAVEIAQKALHEIPRGHITTIADVDPDAAELFRTFGLYDGPPVQPTEPSDPSAEALGQPTESPAQPTESPAQPTESPDQWTAPPAQWTAVPVEPTEPPAQPTEPPDVEESGPQGGWLQGR